MNIKYQIFISSTYEDLKNERRKAIDTIHELFYFPIGMEMFSASDEDQWDVIQDLMDSSDYYVLIVGMRYGTLIPEGKYKGVSYTEREFLYALEKKIPVLAFIMADDVPITPAMLENDPTKAAKLIDFKAKVKTGRVVKFWHNADELAVQLTQSLCKATARGNRPGWVRTTDFDIEKSYAEITRLTERVHTLEALNSDLRLQNNRKPHLYISYQKDFALENEWKEIQDKDILIDDEGTIHFTVKSIDISDAIAGIIYKDKNGIEICASADEVKSCRYLCKNGFQLLFNINNDGNARATGVRIHWKFPSNLMVIGIRELYEYVSEDIIRFSEDAYEGWYDRFLEPDQDGINENLGSLISTENQENKFILLDELIAVDGIANLLDPAEMENNYSIFPGEISFETDEIKHKDSTFFRGVYILPIAPGEYDIICEILCNEMSDVERQIIKVVID